MDWLQLRLRTDARQAAELERLLEEAGAVSVTMADAADQPLFEPGPGETPLWRDILITGLFPADSDATELTARLRLGFLPGELPPVSASTLREQNWERAWMDSFQAMRFGKRLWICPSWCEVPDPQGINLMLDPGLAFGTGTHPTTDLCLQWLDAHPPRGQTLVDYGCGSGILGMAALLLGAATVLGVDNDPQAMTASRDNCTKNGIPAERFETWLPQDFVARVAELGKFRADGILANILAAPLMGLADTLAPLVRPGGWLLLSGILEKQAQDVCDAYRPWFDITEIHSLDGWVRIEAVRKPQ